MRTIQYIFVLLFFGLASTLSLQGQKKKKPAFDRKITIERDYKPVILDVKKINREPNFVEAQNPRLKPAYTLNFSKPMEIEQSIIYLSPAQIDLATKRQREGFLRLGVGSGFNTLADFAMPFIKKPNTKLDFVLNHYALWSKKEHSISKATLKFNQNIFNGQLFSGLFGSYEGFKHYGSMYKSPRVPIGYEHLENDQFVPLRGPNLYPGIGALAELDYVNALKRAGGYIGYKNLTADDDDLSYTIQGDYAFFGSDLLWEQKLGLNSNFEFSFLGGRFGLDGKFTGLLHDSPRQALDQVLKNSFVVSLTPYYLLSGDDWDLRLGVNANFVFGGSMPLPTPDVSVEYRLFPEHLALYAAASGEYQINSFDKIYSENCFYAPGVAVDNLQNTLRLNGGVKIKPFSGLLIDLYADYKEMKNQYFFINKEYRREPSSSALWETNEKSLYTNTFEAIYSRASLLKFGGKVTYAYHNRVNISLHSAYNIWSVLDTERAWNMPTWEADISADVRVTKQLNLSGNLHSATMRYAKIGDSSLLLSPKMELNFAANYAMEEWFTIFARFNNVANNKYEQWHGYRVDGFSIIAGAIVSF